jgi:Zn ribbon nucleic-acid-binding protein
MATATKATKTFAGLRCPACGEVDCLSIKLETLAVECNECSETITRGEVEAIIAQWTGLFNWIEAAGMFAAPK